MKKFFYVAVVMLLLSGCSAKKQQTTNNESPAANEATNSEEQLPLQLDDQSATTSTSTISSTTASSSSELQNINAEELYQHYRQAIIKTSLGDITVEFYTKDSPKTVNNFLKLARSGFYDGTKFHRVMKDFMIQGGDPNSKDNDWSDDGFGGPGYAFEDEFNTHALVLGSLAMANSGEDTNGSQFFIVTAKSTPWLDGRHTNFGYVVNGLDVVKKIEAVSVNQSDHPLKDVTVNSVQLVK